jgi:hypothetical protein
MGVSNPVINFIIIVRNLIPHHMRGIVNNYW